MSWEPINLAKLKARPAILPTIGGVDLVYPGKRHVFSGPPESAKTLAAYAIGIEEIRLDGNVLLIDFEMGQWDARDRLREMGATDEELEHVFYIEPETPATEAIVADLVSRWTFSLVIIDAAAGAYSLQALDDNKRADVETFTRIYVRSFWLHGVATVVLDHVPKNAGNRIFAIGSERKVGGADVHLGFETVPGLAIKRGGRGLYKILTHKDRLGHLERPKAAELELRSDPDTHAITWTFRKPEYATEGEAFRPTILMEKVSLWLENQRDAVTRNDVERNVTGKGEYVRLALSLLVDEGYVAETVGPRGSRPVHSVLPFRHDDRVPTASPPRPDAVEHPSPRPRPASHPLGGDAVEDELADEHLVGADLKRNGRPLIGDDGYLERMFTAFEKGLITEGEWKRADRAHRFVRARGVA